MGRIIQVHQGNDGLIRTATLQMQKGQLKRPVQRLHNLEVEQNIIGRELEKASKKVELLTGDQGGGCSISNPLRAKYQGPKDFPSIVDCSIYCFIKKMLDCVH